MNGVLIIDKPSGWTSMDVCAKLRGVYHEKRVGHAGTLDPMATGVLPIFLGRATRAVEYAAEGDKEYVAGLKLGVVTNTQDTTGEVLQQHPVTVDRAALQAILPRFTGALAQIPPMYSAIKKDGQKLYELARKGVEVERKPRQIVIKDLEITNCIDKNTYELRVLCSKGTYVRTLCHDIGTALGCGGAMCSLRRTMAAGYTLEDAVTLEQVLNAADPAALVRSVDSCFAEYPAVQIEGKNLFKAKNGNPFPWDGAEGIYRVYSTEDEFLLLGQCRDGMLTTMKSFFEVN